MNLNMARVICYIVPIMVLIGNNIIGVVALKMLNMMRLISIHDRMNTMKMMIIRIRNRCLLGMKYHWSHR